MSKKHTIIFYDAAGEEIRRYNYDNFSVGDRNIFIRRFKEPKELGSITFVMPIHLISCFETQVEEDEEETKVEI